MRRRNPREVRPGFHDFLDSLRCVDPEWRRIRRDLTDHADVDTVAAAWRAWPKRSAYLQTLPYWPPPWSSS